MKNTAERQPLSHVSPEIPAKHVSPQVAEDPIADSNSVSEPSNDNRKVSREEIEFVQNLIERCLKLYMNKGEVIRTLSSRARIEPGFTTLVWKKLEEENADFFRAYYIRLKLKKQIIMFNYLLEHQYHLMNYPVPVNNLPIGYPVHQPPPMPTTGQPHAILMNGGLSSCHVVNGIPAPGSFHPIRMNSGTNTMMDCIPAEVAAAAQCSGGMSTMSEMPVSPASVASSNHFPFTPSEISRIGIDATGLDSTFTSDVVNTGDLHLGPDDGLGCSRDSLRSLGQLWDFSLSDLTTDLANLGGNLLLSDPGALGDYIGSPFLPSDSDILLDSPDHDIVEEYFVDVVNGQCSQADEEKS